MAKPKGGGSRAVPGMAAVLAFAGPLCATVPERGAGPQADLSAPDAAHARDLDCLASAIGHEAGNQPQAGQEAVAAVVLNRLRDPAFPKSVCGVVFQGAERRTGCQFTFTCDGSLARALSPRVAENARRIAALALDGALASAIGSATFYHAFYVQPAWAARMERVARIGAHIFYRPLSGGGGSGGGGQPVAPLPVAAPVATALAVWGLKTATLVPVGNAIAVRP